MVLESGLIVGDHSCDESTSRMPEALAVVDRTFHVKKEHPRTGTASCFPRMDRPLCNQRQATHLYQECCVHYAW